jgi:hypothetical protein
MKNEPKHGVRSRGWWTIESDSDASQIPFLHNETKVYTADTSFTAA